MRSITVFTTDITIFRYVANLSTPNIISSYVYVDLKTVIYSNFERSSCAAKESLKLLLASIAVEY
jgi:hypothetical protein